MACCGAGCLAWLHTASCKAGCVGMSQTFSRKILLHVDVHSAASRNSTFYQVPLAIRFADPVEQLCALLAQELCRKLVDHAFRSDQVLQHPRAQPLSTRPPESLRALDEVVKGARRKELAFVTPQARHDNP